MERVEHIDVKVKLKLMIDYKNNNGSVYQKHHYPKKCGDQSEGFAFMECLFCHSTESGFLVGFEDIFYQRLLDR